MDMWTVSRVWNMVRRNMSIQNTYTNRMILERKLSRFTISFWFILLLLMTVMHCRSWHNAGIAEDLFPWRSTEHRCLADYTMVLFLQSLHGADIWWYLGNPLDAFSFLFSLSCIKQCILKRKLLSWVVNRHYRPITAAQPRIHWRCWWRKYLFGKSIWHAWHVSFHNRFVSFLSAFFQFTDGLPSGLQLPCAGRGASCPDETPAVEDICKVCLDAVGFSVMSIGKTN